MGRGIKWYPIEFRMKVIQDKLENGLSAQQLALKYDLSGKRIVEKWLTWYRQNGVPKQAAKNTGKKRTGRPRKVLTEETLEQKVARLEMENALLKKFHELLEEETKRK